MRSLAEDVLNAAVLPRLLRALLTVEEVIKNVPDEATLALDVDLTAICRIVSTAPGG